MEDKYHYYSHKLYEISRENDNLNYSYNHSEGIDPDYNSSEITPKIESQKEKLFKLLSEVKLYISENHFDSRTRKKLKLLCISIKYEIDNLNLLKSNCYISTLKSKIFELDKKIWDEKRSRYPDTDKKKRAREDKIEDLLKKKFELDSKVSSLSREYFRKFDEIRENDKKLREPLEEKQSSPIIEELVTPNNQPEFKPEVTNVNQINNNQSLPPPPQVSSGGGGQGLNEFIVDTVLPILGFIFFAILTIVRVLEKN